MQPLNLTRFGVKEGPTGSIPVSNYRQPHAIRYWEENSGFRGIVDNFQSSARSFRGSVSHPLSIQVKTLYSVIEGSSCKNPCE